MISEDVQIHHRILERFKTLQARGRLAHAYLFIGPLNSGKFETAVAVAKMLNCEQPPQSEGALFCDQCLSCKKIISGNHPDIHILDSAYGDSIKIEQARDLLSHMKMRPFSADKKIFIINHIENFTKEAANAILKTLEEPSPNSLILLTTSVIEKNLDTVRSRCHSMHFLPTSKTKLADRLAKYYDGDSSDFHFLAYFAEGCLGKARVLKENGLFARKNEMIDHFILSQPDENFTKKILQDKERTKEFLDVMLSWVRDSLLLKAGVAQSNVIHIDRIRELEKFQSKYTFRELNDLNQELIRMSKLLSENLNIKIPLMIIKEKLIYE